MTNRRLAAAIMPIVLGSLLVTPPAIRAQTGTGASPGPSSQAVPPRSTETDTSQLGTRTATSVSQRLLNSLQLQQRAVAMIVEAKTHQDLVAAGNVILEAYFQQRAAHSRLVHIERSRAGRQPGSLASEQSRIVGASRHNLTKARFVIKGSQPTQTRRIERGLGLLRAAIAQTNAVLATAP